jgi:hypothetical protein
MSKRAAMLQACQRMCATGRPSGSVTADVVPNGVRPGSSRTPAYGS